MRGESSNKTARLVFYVVCESNNHVNSWHTFHRTPSLQRRVSQLSAFTVASYALNGDGGHVAHCWNCADETRSAGTVTAKVN